MQRTLLIIAAAATFALTGCGKDEPKPMAPAAAPAAPAAAPEASATPASTEAKADAPVAADAPKAVEAEQMKDATDKAKDLATTGAPGAVEATKDGDTAGTMPTSTSEPKK